MNVRGIISILADMGAHDDIREFEVQAYDADDEKWRPVTGITVSPQRKTILIHTDTFGG